MYVCACVCVCVRACVCVCVCVCMYLRTYKHIYILYIYNIYILYIQQSIHNFKDINYIKDPLDPTDLIWPSYVHKDAVQQKQIS